MKNEFAKKKIVVVGLGRSGLSASRWLSGKGAEITVSERKEMSDLDRGLIEEMRTLGITLETGSHRPETFLKADLIIVSPGVPLDIGPLKLARGKGIAIVGELEMAVSLIDIPIVAVTGTNGKSTTTAFIGEVLKQAGLDVFVGGNIGTPLMDYFRGVHQADYAVIEVSSFQLDTMDNFAPSVSVLLNISPDHLDRYPDFEAYVQSKCKIFENQGRGQYAILNDDDIRLCRLSPGKEVSVLRFGFEEKNNRQAFVEGKKIRVHLPGMKGHSFSLNKFKLLGRHNLENLMASILAARALQIDPLDIQEAIDRFKGLSHRLELVKAIGGVTFYNDSKATNVDAALKSINSFDRPIILIAGGRDKGGDYTSLAEASKGKVRRAILLGESKDLLATNLTGKIPYEKAGSMADAVSMAYRAAEADNVVLLAPACSSFDMFSDYRHRGTVFKEAVEGLNHGS